MSPIQLGFLVFSFFDNFSELDGAAAPKNWQGGFNCTYNYGGPGFKPTSRFNDRWSKLMCYYV